MAPEHRPVLLLNPPCRRPVLRDYYCSTFPKASYYWQPIDLLSAAAILKDQAEIMLIDAVARRLTAGQVAEIVADHDPRAIFCLVSTLTRESDLALVRGLASPGRKIVLGGEAALDPDFDFERFDFVDGLLLDFTDAPAVEFLVGAAPAGRLRAPDHEPAPPRVNQSYSVGMMPHHLLAGGTYRLPLWRGGFSTLLTDFGCPWDCSFCNSGRRILGYKWRDMAEVAGEARLLRQGGAEKVFLKDMTFGADPSRAQEILSLLAPYTFKLRGYLRADLVTPDCARRLKQAGFELAQIGVESPRADVRKDLQKNISDPVVAGAFKILRQEGIAAGAHFIVGFAADRPGAVAACVRQARSLGAAYCSVNVYQPRLGTVPLPAVSDRRKKLLSLRAAAGMACYNLPSYLRFLIRS